MTKKDLKNGMIVELRDGTRYLYCEGIMRGLDAWDSISVYSDDLKCLEFPHLDIVKVYEDTREYDLNTIFKHDYLKLIWQRPKTPKLSEREIEVLKALDTLNYKFLARDYNENKLYAYFDKPERTEWWFATITYLQIESNLFPFITWIDQEPTSIKKLLEQDREVSQWIKQK